MREWLTIIVVLLIVGILLDGWRRMRQSRQASIKMSLSMHNGTDKEDLQNYGSELPNGGARVIVERDADDAKQKTLSVQESFANKRSSSFKSRIPEQVSLNLDEIISEEEVPMLMEATQQEASEQANKGVLSSDEKDSADSAASSVGILSKTRIIERQVKHQQVDSDCRIEPTFSATLSSGIEEEKQDQSESAPSTEQDNLVTKTSEKIKPAAVKEKKSDKKIEVEPEEVLIINVMAKSGQQFDGGQLLDQLIDCGMRYGEMQIFHRHSDDEGAGPVLFSMVNMVKPGVFDLNSMQDFQTPGVSIFMTLPLESNALAAFDRMADTARTIAAKLDGELKDENRSVMTTQTIEHCRQRICDFERKQLSRAH